MFCLSFMLILSYFWLRCGQVIGRPWTGSAHNIMRGIFYAMSVLPNNHVRALNWLWDIVYVCLLCVARASLFAVWSDPVYVRRNMVAFIVNHTICIRHVDVIHMSILVSRLLFLVKTNHFYALNLINIYLLGSIKNQSKKIDHCFWAPHVVSHASNVSKLFAVAPHPP